MSRLFTLTAPLSVVYEVTNCCNLNCFFCYNKINRIKQELSTKDALRLIEELGELGCFSIDFSGGPLLRSDLFTLAKVARKNFNKVNLLTNATIINEGNVGKLKEVFDVVQVSLDGSKKEVHDRIRGQGGAFEKALKGIKLLVKEKCYTSIAFTLNKINLHDVIDVIKLVYSMDVDEIRIGLMRPFNSITRRYSLSPNDVAEVNVRINSVLKLFKNKITIRALFPYFLY
ncbi:MAG: radical SAM protein [Thermoproteota archaeon]|jgi:MoaA/NifB/PqqE/SkfB family radical SAM enzyme